jgi:hypothetical protein
MDLKETEAWTDCAGEGNKQFNRPTGLESIEKKTPLEANTKQLLVKTQQTEKT